MAVCTYDYNWSGYPKFRVVVNSLSVTNRTANSATVNYDITASISGWYHYDLNLAVKCGNGSKSHKMNPWGTKNDNSGVYRDSRRLTGSFNITNLNNSSSVPGVQIVFSSGQNKHGNVTFGNTSSSSPSKVNIPAYANAKPTTSSNAGNGSQIAPPNLNMQNNSSKNRWTNDAENQAEQWIYDTFTIDSKLEEVLKQINVSNTLTTEDELNKQASNLTNNKIGKYGTFTYSGTVQEVSTIRPERTGILGLPFQFNENADVKSSEFGYQYLGRTYTKFIWNNMPIVYFEVGKPLYLDSLFSSKSSIGKYFQGLYGSQNEAELASSFENSSDLLAGLGGLSKTRFYTFMDDYANYSMYVNTMVRYTALSMGLGDEICSFTNRKYRKFDIIDIRNDSLWSFFKIDSNYIPFYCNVTNCNISESGSNSIGESVMSTMFSNANSLSREVQYLFGTNVVNNLSENEANANSLAEQISKLANNLGMDGSGLAHRLGTITSCLSGANILFPLMWQDSQFSKTYTLNFKFSSPYGDPESILMNVYLPYFCLLAMALPRQASSQGYKSPFLVKVSSKGWFNCDMGMIESIDIKRGGTNGDQWTVDSLPTEIEVTVNIRDLYPAMMASASSGSGIFFSGNSAFTDYLTMMSGIDMHTVTPGDKLWVMANMLKDDVIGIPEKIVKKWKYNLNSKIKYIVRKYID